MIFYEVNTSSFYKANEDYCKRIEQLFHSLNIVFDGYCNSWGYDLSVTYIKNNLTSEFRFYKDTITRKYGDSVISEGLDIEIYTLNKNHKLKIQQSNLKRLFMTKELKSLISAPYYFKSNINFQTNDIIKWVSLFEKYEMYLLKLNTGKLEVEINQRVEDPLKLISELEPMIKFYI